MIHTAIILAGGLGTRLRSVVSELPKCMAPVAGKPFLSYVIDQLRQQQIQHIILSVGYKSGSIIDYVQQHYPGPGIQFSIEDEPLGTGGAIQAACGLCTEPDVFVLNGDTLFTIDLQALATFHTATGAHCSLALKPMQHITRYGVVELEADGRIARFNEKKAYDAGLINGGIYALQVARFVQEDLPPKFSFEQEYLEVFYRQRHMYGQVQDAYFIDIGIPEDYERAQVELAINH